MNSEILKLENISFAYDDETTIDNVTVSLKSGDKIAVLGSNGAGKSTLFLLCNGVLTAKSGRIYFGGKLIGKSKKELNFLRENVGLVFQDPDHQIIASTVYSEISFGPLNLNIAVEDAKSRVENAIQTMNLENMRNKPPHYLSGGEKKRVTIADILAMNSEVILLDEPTASLDPKNVIALKKTLDKLSENNKTLMISTHDINFAYGWANRIIVMNDGKIICDDIPENIFAQKQVLEKASLNEPYVFKFYQMLKEKNLLKKDSNTPNSIEQLKEIIIGD
ncbi:MAG: ABC transporter ATP-binding protein [Oscillospiraceae bacterium]